MSNLLPEANKKKIESEYRARFILAGSFLAMGAAIFTVLVLSPSFGVLYVTSPGVVEQAAAAQQNKSDSAELARAQALLLQFSPVASATSSISRALGAALTHRPKGVHIDSISYTPGKEAVISLGGIADSREVMDKYRAALQDDTQFTSVKLPVGDLVGVTGGRFTVTLTGKF
jgi:hypothetical protein